jgi:hemoglobin
MTMFERYGGIKGVEALVRDFYRDVLDEPELATYFTGLSVESIILHQVDLFCHIMGGPCPFDLKRLERAHQSLNISSAHFDLVSKILVENLEDANFEPADLEEMAGIVASVKPLIVFE